MADSRASTLPRRGHDQPSLTEPANSRLGASNRFACLGVVLRRPAARFVEMGDSALIFRVQLWTKEPALPGECIDGLNKAIYNALGRAGIEIPFPQRVVPAASPQDLSS